MAADPAADRPQLRVVDADASPDEVAAIVAVVAALTATGGGEPVSEPASRWVYASRLRARRAGLSRGEWRLSGRIGRRARA